jgi:hypothetical protein
LNESDAECEGSSDGAAAAELPRKLIHYAMGKRFSKMRTNISQESQTRSQSTISSILGCMRCCHSRHSFRLFNSARAVWSKDANLLILKSDALMVETAPRCTSGRYGDEK